MIVLTRKNCKYLQYLLLMYLYNITTNNTYDYLSNDNTYTYNFPSIIIEKFYII